METFRNQYGVVVKTLRKKEYDTRGTLHGASWWGTLEKINALVELGAAMRNAKTDMDWEFMNQIYSIIYTGVNVKKMLRDMEDLMDEYNGYHRQQMEQLKPQISRAFAEEAKRGIVTGAVRRRHSLPYLEVSFQ